MAVVNEEHIYEKDSTETFADLEKAIAMMGTVSSSNPEALTIEGKIKYGLGAKTNIKAQVKQDENGSVISFESRGGDVFGNAARNNVEHLLEAMGRAHDPDFDVNKADNRQWLSLGLLIVALLLIVLAFFAVSQGLMSLALAGGVFGVFLLLSGMLVRRRQSA